MKKTRLIILAAAFMSPLFGGEATLPTNQWTYTFTQLTMSKYFGSWVGGIFRNDPFSFTTLAAKKPMGMGSFYVDGSVGETLGHVEWNSKVSQELDADVGYTWSLGKGPRRIGVDYHLSYIGATPLGDIGNDIVSNVVSVNLPECPGVQPYLTVIRSDTLGKVPGSGWFVYAGATKEFRITDTLVLNVDYRTGYSGGIYGASPGWVYHRLGLSVPLSIGTWVVTPTVIGQVSAHGQRPIAFVDRSRLFTTISFSRIF